MFLQTPIVGLAEVDTIVLALSVILALLPIMLVRGILKDWAPDGFGGLVLKGLIVFGSPFYIGIIVIKVLELTGFISTDFAQLFPSMQETTLPVGTVSFWSEFSVGLMLTTLAVGLYATLVFYYFGSKIIRRVGGAAFWGFLYISAIFLAAALFDRIQELTTGDDEKKTASKVNVQLGQTQQSALGFFQTPVLEDGEGAGRGLIADILGNLENIGDLAFVESLFRKARAFADISLGNLAEKASDSTLMAYMRYQSEQVNFLIGDDSAACYYFLAAGTYLHRFSQTFQAANEDTGISAAREQFETVKNQPTSTTKTAPMSDVEYQATTEKLFSRVRQALAFENQNFAIFDSPFALITEDEKRQGCTTYLSFLNELQALEEEEAAAYTRKMLAERAANHNSDELLAANSDLFALYLRLVPRGSAFSVVFEDVPKARKAFVVSMATALERNPATAREVGLGLKAKLMNQYSPYYFARASDEAIFDHLIMHRSMLERLDETNAVACGAQAGVLDTYMPALEEGDRSVVHNTSLSTLFRSARINQEEPAWVSGSELASLKRTLERKVEDSFLSGQPNFAGIYDPTVATTPAQMRATCWTAIEFYRTLSEWDTPSAAAFFRGLMLDRV